jgi:uncharacterized membrane protein YhhN
MTATAWAALAVAALFGAGNWIAVASGRKALEYVCKPATMVALVVVALALEPVVEGRRAWFVVALVLSLAGDVFLMLPRDLFLAGLVSFLAGHVAYVIGLRAGESSAAAVVVAAAAVAVVAAVVGTRVVVAVRQGPHAELISTMVTCALATGNVLAAAGASLFFASDALIAWNRFVRPRPWVPVAIMVTYHLGQAGLVTSLVQ